MHTFEVVTLVTVTITVFWHVTPYCLVGSTKVSGAPDAGILESNISLKLEATNLSETSLPVFPITA